MSGSNGWTKIGDRIAVRDLTGESDTREIVAAIRTVGQGVDEARGDVMSRFDALDARMEKGEANQRWVIGLFVALLVAVIPLTATIALAI
jgi:hypothetical protein